MGNLRLGNIHEIPGPVLVVTAHPDDIEIHCGGTIVQLVAQGKDVTCVLCTSGNRGTDNPAMTMDEIGATREKEQRAASEILGVKNPKFLRHDDGDLAFTMPQLREEIVRLIREVRPQSVITHDPYPGNGGQDSCSIYPDHTSVGMTTFESAYICAPGSLFYPEHLREGLLPFKPSKMYLIMSADPDFFIDITDIWQTKLAAIRKHNSQGRYKPENDHEMERINKENGGRVGVERAEAFRLLLPT
ncbi:MAG: PIG-L family deacetylase [Chloroflexi bacterium]|nr:PIG-L family deacetylase [Chloroflexota bacterium]